MNKETIKIYFDSLKERTKFCRNENKVQIERYFSVLTTKNRILNSSQEKINRYLSEDFNVFNFIQPDENKISDIIADFLRLNGSHGQGDIFLRSFLRRIDKPYFSSTYKVTREAPTTFIQANNKRLDILVNFGTFGFGIENKPWAGEQPLQLKNYQSELIKRFGENYFIVFLTKDAHEPVSLENDVVQALLVEKKLILASFSHFFLDWLSDCYKECVSDRFRFFIRDFIIFVSNNLCDFEGES